MTTKLIESFLDTPGSVQLYISTTLKDSNVWASISQKDVPGLDLGIICHAPYGETSLNSISLSVRVFGVPALLMLLDAVIGKSGKPYVIVLDDYNCRIETVYFRDVLYITVFTVIETDEGDKRASCSVPVSEKSLIEIVSTIKEILGIDQG